MRPLLSVIVPTVGGLDDARPALSSLPLDRPEAVEVLLADGSQSGDPGIAPATGVRWIRRPGADIFELRAAALAVAGGVWIAASEDHIVHLPGWSDAVLSAAAATRADLLVGAMQNHPDSSRTARDRMSFLSTFAPFQPPLRVLSPDRAPVPANVAVRGDLVVDAPSAGWFEYALLPDLLRSGRAAPMAAIALHRQPWTIGDLLTTYVASGRAFGDSVRAWPEAERRAWIRRLPAVFRLQVRQCRSHAGRKLTASERLWIELLAATNTLGQAIGIGFGAGSSRSRLH